MNSFAKLLALTCLVLTSFHTCNAQTNLSDGNFLNDESPNTSFGPYENISQRRPSFLNSLNQYGFTFGISEALEGYDNFSGGIEQGRTIASTFDANISVDLQKLADLSGAMIYADLEDHAGGNPTAKLVGDAQTFDKNTADPFFQVLELWYQQKLFHDKLRLKLGKVDANSEFSVITNGLGFINSSTQVTPTLFMFPTFPDPMPAVNVFFTPDKHVYTSFGIFDANQKDHFLNFYGSPQLAQPTQNGQLFISETGLKWHQIPFLHHSGNFKLGLWLHNGTFTRFDGTKRRGAEGYYVIFDQTLWKPEEKNADARSLKMFLEYGRSNSNLTGIYRHYGGGMVWNAPFKKRPDDALGLTAQNARFSPYLEQPNNFELEIETYYKLQISSWINAKPDLQYIVNPGGQYANALVGTLLFNFSLNS